MTGDKHQFEWIAESAAKEMGALFEGELPEVSNFETLNPIVSAQYGWTGEKVQALLEAYGVAGEGEVEGFNQLGFCTVRDRIVAGELA